jgi:hypothetical protein
MRHSTGQWIDRRDSIGELHRRWVPNALSRIPDELIDCAAFLYPSRKQADDGDKAGGTGFFVGVDWSSNAHRRHLYVVTNKHNITASRDQVVIRATKVDRTLDFIESDPADWFPSPLHDISVLPIGSEKAAFFQNVSLDQFVGPEDFEGTLQDTKLTCLGPGDQVFMVGRFISHDGKTQNHPSVRFGNISMNAAPIRHPTGYEQESFAVDMRSISGYSGSPAFVFFEFGGAHLKGINRTFMHSVLWLLGVDWGHIEMELPVLDSYGKPVSNGLNVKSHTSMSGVVPAWRLKELLLMPRLIEQRATDEAEAVRHDIENPPAALDSGAANDKG